MKEIDCSQCVSATLASTVQDNKKILLSFNLVLFYGGSKHRTAVAAEQPHVIRLSHSQYPLPVFQC